MTATSDQLRDQGQARSLTSEAGEREAFLGLINEIHPNVRVTANNLRDDLDRLGIPEGMRGALFRAAMTAGLIEPVTLELPDGTVIYRSVKSTGTSAHSADVRMYRRTTKRWSE